MQFSLKNLSIRTQVLLPVLFTTFALFIALWITKNNLQQDQAVVSDNTQSLVYYKDSLAKIDDQVYPLRISAVYAIYDADRRDSFLAELKQSMREIQRDLDGMAKRGTFRTEVNQVNRTIEDYVRQSEQAVTFFNRRDQDLVSQQEYNDFIAKYRTAGNVMVGSINELSKKVNAVATTAMAESEKAAQNVQSFAMWTVLSVLSLSLVVAWFLSGMIVTPIQTLQQVMRKIAHGDLSVRAETDGDNEVAQLSQDVNQTLSSCIRPLIT